MTVVRWPCPTEFRVLSIEGPLRAPVSSALLHQVQRLIHGGERHLVLDLDQVSRIDAAGLGQLVRAYNLTRVANATFQVVHPKPYVRELMARAGVLDIFSAPCGPPTVWSVPVTTTHAVAPKIKGADLPYSRPIRALSTPCVLRFSQG